MPITVDWPEEMYTTRRNAMVHRAWRDEDYPVSELDLELSPRALDGPLAFKIVAEEDLEAELELELFEDDGRAELSFRVRAGEHVTGTARRASRSRRRERVLSTTIRP